MIDRISMLLTRGEWLVASHIPMVFGTSVLCIAKREDSLARKEPQGSRGS